MGRMGVVGGVKNAWDADEEELRVLELTGELVPLSSLSASLRELLDGRLSFWSRRAFALRFRLSSLFSCLASFCLGGLTVAGPTLMTGRTGRFLFGTDFPWPRQAKTRKASEGCFLGGELSSVVGGLSILRSLAASSTSLVSLLWSLSSWTSLPLSGGGVTAVRVLQWNSVLSSGMSESREASVSPAFSIGVVHVEVSECEPLGELLCSLSEPLPTADWIELPPECFFLISFFLLLKGRSRLLRGLGGCLAKGAFLVTGCLFRSLFGFFKEPAFQTQTGSRLSYFGGELLSEIGGVSILWNVLILGESWASVE